MRRILLSGIILAGTLSLFTTDASAVVCARGMHGAACVGPNGAIAGRRYYGGRYIYRGGRATVRHYGGPYRSRTVIRRY